MLGAQLLVGCASYRSATLDRVPAGARLRVALTPAGTAALTPALGGAVTAVEGRWTGAHGDSLGIHVDRLLTGPGVTMNWAGSDVVIRRAHVRTLERSVRSRGRTALLVGGVTAGAIIALDAIRRSGGAKGDPGGGGPVGF